MLINEYGYGVDDNSYRAAGNLEGITQLANAFYDNMDSLEEAQIIRRMHGSDLDESRKKLAYFLSGWLGGPRLYAQHFGAINIPGFHQKFRIGKAERDAWLCCMKKAIDIQPYESSFKQYLLTQLSVPAERVRQASEKYLEHGG